MKADLFYIRSIDVDVLDLVGWVASCPPILREPADSYYYIKLVSAHWLKQFSQGDLKYFKGVQ